MQRKAIAHILLTAALAFVFGYLGLDKLLRPEAWAAWTPSWMEGATGLSAHAWLTVIGLLETLFALLLLVPIRIVRRTGAILIALLIIMNLTQGGWTETSVRDLGLLLANLALFFLI